LKGREEIEKKGAQRLQKNGKFRVGCTPERKKKITGERNETV